MKTGTPYMKTDTGIRIWSDNPDLRVEHAVPADACPGGLAFIWKARPGRVYQILEVDSDWDASRVVDTFSVLGEVEIRVVFRPVLNGHIRIWGVAA